MKKRKGESHASYLRRRREYERGHPSLLKAKARWKRAHRQEARAYDRAYNVTRVLRRLHSQDALVEVLSKALDVLQSQLAQRAPRVAPTRRPPRAR